MTNFDFVLPDCDSERRAAILSDVPAMLVERLRLLQSVAISGDLTLIAVWLRRVDKIEERFSEIGLASDGIEHI